MTKRIHGLLSIAAMLLVVAPLGAQSQSQRERERERERRERDRAQEQRDRQRERDRDDDQPYRTRIDTTITFGRGGIVDLSLMSGQIVVTGTSASQARIRASSERGRLRTDISGTRIAVSTDERYRSGEARIEVSVPYGSRVRMRSMSADQSARGVRGEVEAHTVSGDVEILDATERVEIETVSGDVSASRISGTFRAATVSGEIDLGEVTGEIDAESVSGEIRLPRATSRRVRMETVSGGIEFGGGVDRAGRYEFHSHSGAIRLALPTDLSAVFHVETFSGGIESDFPITLQPNSRPTAGGGTRVKRYNFTLGNGGADITAETFSGDITLERGTGTGTRPPR